MKKMWFSLGKKFSWLTHIVRLLFTNTKHKYHYVRDCITKDARIYTVCPPDIGPTLDIFWGMLQIVNFAARIFS